jgi:tetratricopeptide (TPR) repeat protein
MELPNSVGGVLFDQHARSWYQQLTDWMDKKMETLERKRMSEIERLAKLFEENPKLALEYAIPLNNKYENRGKGNTSSSLSRSPINFNLRNLRGGGAVDSWDIGDRYNELREKYNRAAAAAIAEKDFKRAAYVYAHLLGNYYAAASTLRDGGHFQEAAILFRDHLKNELEAAKCFEEGGMNKEAIVIREKMCQYEVVGDLYTKMNDPEKATQYYWQEVNVNKEKHYLYEAARIAKEKLKAPLIYEQLLLEGWERGKNDAEKCLLDYFKMDADPHSRVQYIYHQQTAFNTHLSFLRVVLKLLKAHPGDQLFHTSRKMAYEIVEKQASSGNMNSFSMLETFVKGDSLWRHDCDRFTTNQHIPEKRSIGKYQPGKMLTALHNSTLEVRGKSGYWLATAVFREQLLLLFENNMRELLLCRTNIEGVIKYYKLGDLKEERTTFGMLADAVFSKNLYVYNWNNLPVREVELEENQTHAIAIHVKQPTWINQEGIFGFALNQKGEIVSFHLHNLTVVFYRYSPTGEVLEQKVCYFENQEPLEVYDASFTNIIYRSGHFYMGCGRLLVRISEAGLVEATEFESQLHSITASDALSLLRIVVATTNGCYLVLPSVKEMQVLLEEFAQHMVPSAVHYIPDNRLVITDEKNHQQAEVYHIRNNFPLYCYTIKTASDIWEVLPVYKRNYCALLLQSGEMVIYHLEEESA